MVVLFKGKESEKIVHGKKVMTTPYMGTDSDSEHCQMGVGLLYGGKKDFFTEHVLSASSVRNLAASYRGMKIAELVPEFGRDTLTACWYAGQRDIHLFEDERERYISKVEKIIGAEKRKQILEAPLPSFDKTIQTLQERGIDIDVDSLLEEIEYGTLETTPVVEEVVQRFSDEHLIVRGVKGEYELALNELRNPGLLRRLKNRFFPNPCLEKYLLKAEIMLQEVLPLVEKKFDIIVKSINRPLGDADKPEQWVIDRYTGCHTNIKLEKDKAYNAIKNLRAETRRKLKLQQAFIHYHDNLENLTHEISNIAFDYHELERLRNEKGMKENAEMFSKNEEHARRLLRLLNRSVQRMMPGIYGLR